MPSYVIELDFEKDPSRLLEELGLRTKHFQKVKENILTRLAGRPELVMIVIEFRRDGMYFGEVTYGQSDDYQQARTERSKIIGQSLSGGNPNRPEEPAIGGDDGVSDGNPNGGWSLEKLLRDSAKAV